MDGRRRGQEFEEGSVCDARVEMMINNKKERTGTAEEWEKGDGRVKRYRKSHMEYQKISPISRG